MDSELVATFLEEYARIKSICSDNPKVLANISKENNSVIDLCKSIYNKSAELRSFEDSRRQVFSSPTNPTFIKAWREWCIKFEGTVFEILFQKLKSEEYLNMPPDYLESIGISKWTIANIFALEKISKLEMFFVLSNLPPNTTKDQITSLFPDISDKSEIAEDALIAWQKLTEVVGVNPVVNIRRRMLTPFVLVPRELSNSISLADKANLIRILEDAQKAFIFEANNAAVALLRSVMEGILRNYYGAEGQRIDELIYNAWGRLPPTVSTKKLNDLRKLANAIMHNSDRNFDVWLGKNDEEIELHILSIFELMRALIEGVK